MGGLLIDRDAESSATIKEDVYRIVDLCTTKEVVFQEQVDANVLQP